MEVQGSGSIIRNPVFVEMAGIMYRENKHAIKYIVPGVLIIILFIYIPVIMNFRYSFFSWASYSKEKRFIGFENYIRLFHDDVFYTALFNNTAYAIISVVFQIGLSLIIAWILEQKFLGNASKFFRIVFYIPSVISMTVVGLLWQMIYNPNIGLLNPLLEVIGLRNLTRDWLGDKNTAIYAVISVSQWQYIGSTMMLFIVAMQKIPQELFESAAIDGAGGMKQFIYVAVPQCKEAILMNLIVTIVNAFKVFDEVYIMTGGGPGRSTEVLGTYLYRAAFRNNEMGYATAISTVLFLITFFISVFQLQFYRRQIGDSK